MESGGAAMAFLLWDKKNKNFFCGKNRINTGLFERKNSRKIKKLKFFKKSTCILEKMCILNESTAKSKRQINKWPVGQGVKTSPSHGENTGSIPVLAATK